MKKAKLISIFNTKGGVGKSTNSANIAFSLSWYGSVLLMDSDQQGSLTSKFLSEKEFALHNADLLQYLKKEISVDNAIIHVRPETKDQKPIDLIGWKRNDASLREYFEGPFRNTPKRLSAIVKEVSERYDYIIIDLPPSFAFYEKEFISQLDELIPIVDCEQDS